VQILDEALEASVRLSHRYIPARQLPDKSVSLLDTSCARVAISQHAVPAELDDCRKSIDALETELNIIEREQTIGIEADERKEKANSALGDERERLEKLESRWVSEKELVDQILTLRQQLRDLEADRELESDRDLETDDEPAERQQALPRETLLEQLSELQSQLKEYQGESPLILPSVDAQAVASVVGDWTGIPVGRMVKNEIETALRLADILQERIIGQRHALEMISKRIQTSRANLDNPGKPVGVFLLAGPSGVGKTETALALAEALYGGEQNIVTINMSEFQEAHTVSTLKGAPPGYVGYVKAEY